ncbi:hypothetical protein [Nereida sp. MMG025]|uniref:hypothetical protein n=1 Tax=Nereida sp. MMG025 TaxID=2909981 RepID=UPI001F36166D|nr:hypothetical protein [Nereida sp. MMG025]MCF6445887.1 hypothetical protein [Nereida sp. MMG025]
MDQLRGGPSDGHVDLRLDALKLNYDMKGSPPLSRSPIPPAPRSSDVLDPEFAAACAECEAGKPCCMTTGQVEDAGDSTRKLVWPVNQGNPQKSMGMIAKAKDGRSLGYDIKTKGAGKSCQAMYGSRPGFKVRGHYRTATVPLTQHTHPIKHDDAFSWAPALEKFVPRDLLMAIAVSDMILSLCTAYRNTQGGGSAAVTPDICVIGGGMGETFRVYGYPEAEITGKADTKVRVAFTTGGVDASAEIGGSLNVTYGSHKIEGAARGIARTSTTRSSPSKEKAPGLVGQIGSIIGNFSEDVSLSSPKKDRVVDRTDPASGVSFEMGLAFEAVGLKLQAKKNTPDLEVMIGKLITTVTLTLSGKLDFIDLAAQVLLSPAGAKLVQEARAHMADDANAVRGELRAEVEVSATGELKHEIASSLQHTIVFNGDAAPEPAALTSNFGGKLRIHGDAKILLHVEAEVWIVDVEAGAAGILNTGWTWQMKTEEIEETAADGTKKSKRQRKKRYYFEGLIASARAYARIGASTSVKRKPPSQRTAPAQGTHSSRSVEMSQTGPQAAVGSNKWNDPNSPQGVKYELIKPTVPKVTDNIPDWQDY